MKRILLVVVAATVLVGAMAPNATAMIDPPGLVMWPSSEPATVQDYKELLRQLRGLMGSIHELQTLTSSGPARAKGPEEKWQSECRGYSPEKTVRCAAVKFEPAGGVEQALSCWRDESGWGIEQQTMGHSYHGPFQYLYSTYASQQESMPDIVEWYELSPAVHDMRSNILTAVAWAARNSWSPWTAPGCS